MLDAPNYIIDLSDADAAELDADQDKKVAWKNTTSLEITLNPPSCVKDPTTTPIPANTTSRNFKIKGKKGTTYDYTFTVGAALGPRSGKIKVNS